MARLGRPDRPAERPNFTISDNNQGEEKMTNSKFASGAFVFTRARGVIPRRPEDVIPLAAKHGLDASIVPPYAGDRAAIGRAIAKTDTIINGQTYLLRPIKRTQSEVVYGIVRERRDGEEHLDHAHEATLRWTAEPSPEYVEGDHTLAKRVHLAYAALRGRIVADDWTAAITDALERLGAVAFREDGRVYWVPPQSLAEVRRLQGFLADVGMILVIAEVEAETTNTVTEVVSESVADQIHKLTLEVAEFDGTQKPSTYARRLEEYQMLRGKCVLYRDALGVGVDEAERALTELEGKVEAMLSVRTKSVVHRDGSMDTPKAPTPASASAPTAITSLKFAGATFTAAETPDGDELLFVSGDACAISAVKALEAMGLAGSWQKAGGIEVNVQNSGPVGAETSIRVRGASGVEVASVGRALAGVGIGVGM